VNCCHEGEGSDRDECSNCSVNALFTACRRVPPNPNQPPNPMQPTTFQVAWVDQSRGAKFSQARVRQGAVASDGASATYGPLQNLTALPPSSGVALQVRGVQEGLGEIGQKGDRRRGGGGGDCEGTCVTPSPVPLFATVVYTRTVPNPSQL
jgi:hypothetical protein